jgi:acetyltransferase-like isoleucine patch superfamily enzyme
MQRGLSTVIEDDVTIGDGADIGHAVVIRAGARIGADVQIGDGCLFTGACVIGDHVAIRTGAIISKATIIEDDVFIGPGVITNHTRMVHHRRAIPSAMLVTRIGRGAVVGAACWILAGVTIGPNVVIGGGAIVTRDILEPGVYVGSPPRLLRALHDDEYVHGVPCDLEFDADDAARYLPGLVR